MKIRLDIAGVRPGMFIEAGVRSTRANGETRHFLDVASGTVKNVRLKNGRHEQVQHAGGILLTSEKYIEALRDAGLTAVVVDTDKSDATPELRALFAGAPGESVCNGPDFVDGMGGRIKWDFLAGLAGEPPYERLRRALAAECLDEVLDGEIWVRAVAPRQDLAHYALGPKGGNKSAAGDLLKAGEHVRLINGRYQSEIYGYVHLDEGELSVLSPVWVAPDRMEAHFISFPQYGEMLAPQREWIADLLEAEGVCRGWLESKVARLLNGAPAERAANALIARGQLPEPGEDGRIRYHMAECHAATDLQDRCENAQVKSGQLLAEVRLAGEGVPGVDLLGVETAAKAGVAAVLRPGENVHCIDQDGIRVFYSLIDGSARCKGDELRVYPLVRVDRDLAGPLDLSESPQDVFVRGSLRAGAELKAAGSVLVDGSVQGGALLQAVEDVAVAGGIVGHETKVVAGGKVEAQFVQHGMVAARGDVEISSHLLNARVRTTGGALNVTGTGGIVGGQVWAHKGIEAHCVGSAKGEGTSIGILANDKAGAKLKELEKTIEFCQKNVLRIFRVLGISGVGKAHFKEVIDRTSADQRQALFRLLRKLKGLSETWEHSLALRRGLEHERESALHAVQVRIAAVAHAGAQFFMGGHKLELDRDVQQPVFTWTPEGIDLKIAS